MPSEYTHIPIMVEDCLKLLDVQPNDCILDGTLGLGGHSQSILEKLGENGTLIGLDQDPEAIKICQKKFSEDPRIHIFHSNTSNFPMILKNIQTPPITKFFMDLGLSSMQLDDINRGFSYSHSSPLDMRMNPKTNPTTAADILQTYTPSELKELFLKHADLHAPPKFLETLYHLSKKDPIKNTDALINAIKKSFYFKNNRRLFIKTCSQVFQALRIEVNQELSELTEVLKQLPDLIPQNGRIVFLTFHSIEDRLIKHTFQSQKDRFKKITKHVIQPSQSEIRQNSRAKSAKLRGYIKL